MKRSNGLLRLAEGLRAWAGAFGGFCGLVKGGFLVALADDVSYTNRMRHMRAGVRLNSRIGIRVEWQENNESVSAGGHTVDISPKGCLAIIPHGFAVGQKLVVTNSLNGQSAEATLIWRGHEGRQGWELGLELENPATDFWGVEF